MIPIGNLNSFYRALSILCNMPAAFLGTLGTGLYLKSVLPFITTKGEVHFFLNGLCYSYLYNKQVGLNKRGK